MNVCCARFTACCFVAFILEQSVAHACHLQPLQPQTSHAFIKQSKLIQNGLTADCMTHFLDLQVFSTYRFTFDHVYAHDSAQADVYMNSARESVLNALQVCTSFVPVDASVWA